MSASSSAVVSHADSRTHAPASDAVVAAGGHAGERGSKAVPVAESAVRGLPVSSRAWKVTQTKRTSSMLRPTDNNSKGIAFRTSMIAKRAHKAAQEEQRKMQELGKAAREEAKRKRAEKQKRRAENELKSAQYQVLDPSKLKKMSKKQLRQVKKTRVNAQGVTEFVDLYK